MSIAAARAAPDDIANDLKKAWEVSDN